MSNRFLVSMVLVLVPAMACCLAVAADDLGHRFGEYPALNAMIHPEQAKNLDLDGKDFLIEVWFKPLPAIKYKAGAPDSLVTKKAGPGLAGYELSYGGDGIVLTLCDKARELDDDLTFSKSAVIKPDAWNYVAAAYRQADRKLVLYHDGKAVKEFADVSLGDMSNQDMFSVGYSENVANSQAHCLIRQVRVWTFAKGLPAEAGAAIAAHQEDSRKLADCLTAAGSCSRWTFGPGNDDVKDQGGGNTLFYVPYGYRGGASDTMLPIPDRVQGRTYYVDAASAGATDDGPGSRERPFKTVRRGGKAAMPGDLLHICAGLYREPLVLRSGLNGKPVTAEGENGTILMDSAPITGWRKSGEGLWVLENWQGKYASPMDAKEDDARSHPGNLLFVNDQPMDFIRTPAELVPGSWTVEPILSSRGPKKFTLCPLPGVDPAQAPVEISEVLGRGLYNAAKFNVVRGIHFTRGGVGVGKVGNLFENNVIDWTAGNGLGYGGHHNVMRGNKIYWCGLTGFGGGGGHDNVLEGSVISYCCWRPFNGSWHGGAIKIIPSCLDFTMRDNEICYNYIAGIWYDTACEGTINEGNLCHDNAGPGLFDEFCYGNTWRYNVCYNNVGPGFCVGNSNEDVVYRNILFNNCSGGIQFRTDSVGGKNPPELRKALAQEWSPKLDVRRYQGMIPYAREKRWREIYDRYTWEYEGTTNMRNRIEENVVAEHGVLFGQAIYYGKRQVSPEIENVFVKNYYWSDLPDKYIGNGGEAVDLNAWQARSAQDKDSRLIDPFKDRDQMPQWFTQRFHFAPGQFRPAEETWNKYIFSKIRRSIAQVVLYSRLLRSKTIEPAAFADPDISGLAFECEGKKCVAIWSKGPGTKCFLVPAGAEIVCENKFLQKRPLEVRQGRVSVFLSEDPQTLWGVGGELKEDRSVALELPSRTDPGKSVQGKLRLENADSAPRDFELDLRVADGWNVSPRKVTKTLGAGESAEVPLKLAPPSADSQGVFQLNVTGRVGGMDLAASKVFGLGEARVLKTRGFHIDIDGDSSEWTGPPTGIADKAEQVVFGRDKWRGPDDLSAKVRLSWQDDRELWFAIDVKDDHVVTNHRADAPLDSDSVQFFCDVRAPWKQYLNDYTAGAFKIILVPANDGSGATATYDGPPFAYIVKAASKRTAGGYCIEMQIHFRSNLVEAPGWVANRPIRVGVLVNDCDDPAIGRKSTIALWHTAADAAQNCASLTSFMLEK